MPDDPSPIEYYNPKAASEPSGPPPAPAPADVPAAVIPIEFDAELTRTTDHAAVAAIETALRAMKVPTFRADDGQVAGRETVLYVKSADAARAAPIAAGIFARRARVRATEPKREPAGEEVVWPTRWPIDLL